MCTPGRWCEMLHTKTEDTISQVWTHGWTSNCLSVCALAKGAYAEGNCLSNTGCETAQQTNTSISHQCPCGRQLPQTVSPLILPHPPSPIPTIFPAFCVLWHPPGHPLPAPPPPNPSCPPSHLTTLRFLAFLHISLTASLDTDAGSRPTPCNAA